MNHSQATLPGLPQSDATGTAGDPLDRYYTPDALATACVRHLVKQGHIATDDELMCLEPSCGGGAFVRAMRFELGAEVVTVDPDRAAAGHALAYMSCATTLEDAMSWLGPEPWDLVLGNPPFSHAMEHIRLLCDLLPSTLALILPMDWLAGRTPRGGDTSWSDFLAHEYPPARIYPIVGRAWGQHVRECGLWVWDQSEEWSPYVRIDYRHPIYWRGER